MKEEKNGKEETHNYKEGKGKNEQKEDKEEEEKCVGEERKKRQSKLKVIMRSGELRLGRTRGKKKRRSRSYCYGSPPR